MKEFKRTQLQMIWKEFKSIVYWRAVGYLFCCTQYGNTWQFVIVLTKEKIAFAHFTIYGVLKMKFAGSVNRYNKGDQNICVFWCTMYTRIRLKYLGAIK